jgi:hypothetical protein
MNKFLTLVGTALILSLSSCFDLTSKKEETISEADLNHVQINNEYSIKLPKYMTVAKNLNDEASLQYQNIFKETYVIVLDEDKQEFIDTFIDLGEYDSTLSVIENYGNVQVKSMSENMTMKSDGNLAALKINNRDAQTIQFDANIEGVKGDIAYYLTFVEGDDKVYMIMAWTLANRKEKYGKTFDTMVKTFKVI